MTNHPKLAIAGLTIIYLGLCYKVPSFFVFSMYCCCVVLIGAIGRMHLQDTKLQDAISAKIAKAKHMASGKARL